MAGVCALVSVLLTSIMYADNATASLYQQLTGIPMHTDVDREGEREMRHMRQQKKWKDEMGKV